MKVTLELDQGIPVLIASEATSVHDLQILKAGLKKLLVSGKNRVVLELRSVQSITPEALREIAALDLLARELSGRVLVAGVSPELKTKIEMFATPPIISCYSTRAEAVQTFLPAAAKPAAPAAPSAPSAPSAPKPAAAAAPVAPAAPSTTSAPTPAAPTAAKTPQSPAPTAAAAPGNKPDASAGMSRDDIMKRESGDLAVIRKKLAEAEIQIKIYEEQIVKLVISRQTPPNEASYQEKIRTLEAQVEQLATQAQGQAPAAGPAPAKK